CEGFDAFVAVKAPSLAGAAPSDAALDRGLASESSPRSFCQHTNAVRQAYGRNHVRNRTDLGLVKLLWHGALDRAFEHSSIDHARHLQVDRIGCSAVDFARQLHPNHIPADQPELVRLLQLLRFDLGGHRGDLSEAGDLAITKPTT